MGRIESIIRIVFPTVVLLLFMFRTAAVAQPAFEIQDLKCFDDGTLVGWTSELRVAILEDGRWQPVSPDKGILRLWQSPDHRVFALDRGDQWSALEVLHGARVGTRWTLPGTGTGPRFASLNGADVVMPDRIYRLDTNGKLTELADTPIGGSRQQLRDRAPEILASRGTTVVCTGTSEREEDNVGGSCREAKGAYLYLVDFGDPLCCASDAADFTAPFICGDVVISAVRKDKPAPAHDMTQARALATGVLLGRRGGAARLGSTCLDDNRALLIGERDIQVVSVPRLRLLWRRRMARDIKAVAVCGKTKAVIMTGDSPYPRVQLDLTAPVMFGAKAARTRLRP